MIRQFRGVLGHLLLTILMVGICAGAWGQTTSGVINGEVVDSQGAAIVGANITLMEQLTGVTQVTQTDAKGLFVFPVVKPGTYTVSVEKDGFKKLDKKGMVLLAAGHLSAGTLALPVGSVSAAVTVTADVTPVQTTSTERSTEITSEQMQGLMSLGRDFSSLMRILPGSDYEGNGNAMLNSASVGDFNGVSNNYVSINTDGVASNTRNVGVVEGPLNMDAIQEVKVLDANYQAEYGKVAGAIVDVVSKSGTRNFHGSLAYYFRNEDLNANSYFNNRNGVARSRYRYNTINGTIGGPIFGPGRLRSLRDKLFFFFSEDYEPNSQPEGIGYYTLPTSLERQGDFSQSYQPNGSLYVVTDPETGLQFPGNVIPQNRINTVMQKLQSIFPLPNFTNTAVSKRQYNFVTSDSASEPANQQILRLDFDPSVKWRIYFRGTNLTDNDTGRATPGGNGAYWMTGTEFYDTQAPSFALNITYAPTSNIVNELALGTGLWFESSGLSAASLNEFSKTAQGISLGQLYPQNNPLNLIPGLSYGVIPSSPGIGWDPRTPMDDVVVMASVSDGLSWVHREHTMKFGIYADDAVYKQSHHSGNASFAGALTFTGANPNNPYNTGYAFAEPLLGYFDTYQESSARPNYYGQANSFEWYAQDNWRATRKLTLEYGLRFTLDIPQGLKGNEGAALVLSQYDASQAPPMYRPVEGTNPATGKPGRVAEDPTTGKIYPAAYIGDFVPNIGNPASGSVAASSPNFPGFFKSQGVLVVPRVGFAYDVFGNGKMAIRGGFGMFNNQRAYQGQVGGQAFNPPTIFYPTQYYGNVATFLQAQGLLSPSSTSLLQYNSHLPQTMNMTLGVQQDIGFQTVLDIAYVGVLSRHLPYGINLNEVPYGAEFLPQNQDPTTTQSAAGPNPGLACTSTLASPHNGLLPGCTPLPDNFFRPRPGYGSINYTAWGNTGSNHALQVQLNKHFSKGSQFGVAYTWSKSLSYNASTLYLPQRTTYGVTSMDRPQRLVANWLADLPKVRGSINNWATRSILNGWQISGITTFSVGAPQTVSYSTNTGENTTGGGDGAKVTVVGNPKVARGSRTFYRYFNTAAFAYTPVGSAGTGWHPEFYGPGINDWDMSLIKNIPIENKVTFQIRAETYNTFNHTQFSSVNTSAQFDTSGSASTNPTYHQQINPAFGNYTGARTPRLMQLAARITF